MKIIVDAFWDDEAKVWVAQARDEDLGLVTEADTIEHLQSKLAQIVPDLLEHERGPFEIDFAHHDQRRRAEVAHEARILTDLLRERGDLGLTRADLRDARREQVTHQIDLGPPCAHAGDSLAEWSGVPEADGGVCTPAGEQHAL